MLLSVKVKKTSIYVFKAKIDLQTRLILYVVFNLLKRFKIRLTNVILNNLTLSSGLWYAQVTRATYFISCFKQFDIFRLRLRWCSAYVLVRPTPCWAP